MVGNRSTFIKLGIFIVLIIITLIVVWYVYNNFKAITAPSAPQSLVGSNVVETDEPVELNTSGIQKVTGILEYKKEEAVSQEFLSYQLEDNPFYNPQMFIDQNEEEN